MVLWLLKNCPDYWNNKSEELLITGNGEVLEEFMDLLADEGMDAEYWVGRAEWILAEFFKQIK